MRAFLRPIPSSIPDDASPGVREWIARKLATDAENNRSIEGQFDLIGKRKLWTPVLTCATPGNLAVSYSTQNGEVIRTGKEVRASFAIVTSGFTYTTASGQFRITGLPYTATPDSGWVWVGTLDFQGITKASYTQFAPAVSAGFDFFTIVASGSGLSTANCAITDFPTGGTVVLRGTVTYRIN